MRVFVFVGHDETVTFGACESYNGYEEAHANAGFPQYKDYAEVNLDWNKV